jgi:hypothetical protein
MLTPSVCRFLIRLDLILEIFSLQLVIHSVLTTRIILNIRDVRNQYDQPSELHTSYLEMPAVTARLPRAGFVSDVGFREQDDQKIALEPLYRNPDKSIVGVSSNV